MEIQSLIIEVISLIITVIVAYFTATIAMRREQAHGKVRMLELCRRYILISANAERTDKEKKEDSLDKKLYRSELSKIVEDFDKLLANSYVEKLILEYPEVTKNLVALRQELNQHDLEIKEDSPNFNMQNFVQMLDLRKVILKELDKKVKNNPFTREIDEFDTSVRKYLENL